MIVTARVSRFLRSLPDDDAARILDTVRDVATDPDTHGGRCKKLGAGLWEARITLHHRRAYRVMFGYRVGVPVLLSAVLKKSGTDHQHAIDEARQAAHHPPRQKNAMVREPHRFTVTSWVYDSTGRQLRIAHHTRRKVVVATDAGPVELRRSRLERDGIDYAGGVAFRTTKYWLPSEAEEIAS